MADGDNLAGLGTPAEVMGKRPDLAALARGVDELVAPLHDPEGPGLVIGIAVDGQPVWRGGLGLANVEHRVANTSNTRMRIGSVSKQFTCLTALLLAEDGRLDVDAPVQAYLPELPAAAGQPTLRQIMVHAGGLRCYLDLGVIADGPSIHPAAAALAFQIRQRAPNFPAGERMSYSNGAYHLLSVAIERAAGAPFETVLQTRILDPLGMADTRSVPSDMEVHRDLAGLYVTDGAGGHRRAINVTEGLRGEAGMISTLDDMLRWLAHLRGPKLIGAPETWEQLVRPARLANGFQSDYALGLMAGRYRGVRVLHHNASLAGCAAQMMTLPDHGLDIVIMANGSPISPERLSRQIIDLALGEEVLDQRPAPPATANHRSLLGRYHCERSGMLVEVADLNGALGMSVLTAVPLPLVAGETGLVSPFVANSVGHFVIDAAAASQDGPPAQVLDISDSGNPDRYVRLPEAGPPAAEVAAGLLESVFVSPDIDGHAVFGLDNGRLRLHIRGPYGESCWRVEPLSPWVLRCTYESGPARAGVINLPRGDDAGVGGFSLSTARTSNLRFERRAI